MQRNHRLDVIDLQRFTYETNISYADVGPDQCLSYTGLLRLLQETAAAASDICGYGIKDIPTKHVHWILTGWRVELLQRPQWNAPIRIETWPRPFDGFASDRDFLAWSGDALIARGTSRWFLISTLTGRITRVTDTISTAYPVEDVTLFDQPIAYNGKPLPNAEATFSTVVGRRDIDTNSHVNNLHYLAYALEALPQAVYDALPGTLEITYRKQILLGTPIQCLYGVTEDGKHQVEIRSETGGKVTHHAYIWFY